MSADPQIATRSLRAEETLQQLERDGLLRREQARFRTTRRWQAAMARAALRLSRTEEVRDDDLRIPIVSALLELYGEALSRERIVELVEVMLPIEAVELDPRRAQERP
jgi:hypothetical protein